MVDMAAIAGAAGALKSAYDLSKAALGLHDAALIRGKITEMQGEISSALASAITAQTDQIAMLDRIRALEKEAADFETWDAEKQRYELKDIGRGILAYSVKPDAQGAEPSHSICPDCYQQRVKSILQHVTRDPGRAHVELCQKCGWEAYRGGGWRPEHGPTKSASRRAR